MMDKVSIITKDRFQKKFPKKAESEVEITTASGQIFSSGEMSARWDPHSILPTDKELEDKFLWLTSPVIGKTNAITLKNLIMNFDREKNLDQLFSLSTHTCKKEN